MSFPSELPFLGLIGVRIFFSSIVRYQHNFVYEFREFSLHVRSLLGSKISLIRMMNIFDINNTISQYFYISKYFSIGAIIKLIIDLIVLRCYTLFTSHSQDRRNP